jgi:hypothetical protein
MTRLLIIIAALTITAEAQASGCSSIRDTSKRAACYAERDHKPSECGRVRNSDDRALCRVRAR